MTEMATASIFMSGRSQAVRIPKAFQLDAKRVRIRRWGAALILEPIVEEDPWASLKEVVGTFEGVDWEAMTKRDDYPDAPRMGLDESTEHFEKRRREYERMQGHSARRTGEEQGLRGGERRSAGAYRAQVAGEGQNLKGDKQ